MSERANGGLVTGPPVSDAEIWAMLEPGVHRFYEQPDGSILAFGRLWNVGVRRYHETARTQLENGYRATLEPADADPALGFTALKES